MHVPGDHEAEFCACTAGQRGDIVATGGDTTVGEGEGVRRSYRAPRSDL